MSDALALLANWLRECDRLGPGHDGIAFVAVVGPALERAAALVIRYGEHRPGCVYEPVYRRRPEYVTRPCTCGYIAALSPHWPCSMDCAGGER